MTHTLVRLGLSRGPTAALIVLAGARLAALERGWHLSADLPIYLHRARGWTLGLPQPSSLDTLCRQLSTMRDPYVPAVVAVVTSHVPDYLLPYLRLNDVTTHRTSAGICRTVQAAGHTYPIVDELAAAVAAQAARRRLEGAGAHEPLFAGAAASSGRHANIAAAAYAGHQQQGLVYGRLGCLDGYRDILSSLGLRLTALGSDAGYRVPPLPATTLGADAARVHLRRWLDPVETAVLVSELAGRSLQARSLVHTQRARSRLGLL